MEKFEVGCADQIGNVKFNLDIFEQTPSKSESTTKLVTKKMLIFKYYQMDSNKFKCPFQWWAKHETMFPSVGFLAHQILWIIGSQIETKGCNHNNAYDSKCNACFVFSCFKVVM
jgi:hypothetical protein